jgi:hypothetical protein
MRALHVLWCLIAIAGSARASGPQSGDFRPDPESVQRYGPAYRFPQAGWIVLHIEGEPYERGYQHGRLLAPEIADHLRCMATLLTPHSASEGWRHTRRLVNALFLRRFAKEYLEEMKGIADGATAAGQKLYNRPIDLVDIAALNCWPEIETLESALEALPTGLEGMRFPHAQPRGKPEPRPEHCSAFAATGPATADGKIVFGHITMFGLYSSYFYNVWLDIKPAKGHRMFMCGYPGAMQSGMDYYMNDAGLLIAETTISQTRFDINGLSEASRIRQAIQYANTIDGAVAILEKENNGLYTNEWLLADINTNEIALFELGTHKSKLHRSSKNEWVGGTTGFYWGCNNTKDIELRLETVASVKGRPKNVVFQPSDRDKVWQRLYEKHKGKIGVAFGMEAFTTPPIAAFRSLDAKFTTTDLAKQLKSWALFGPPLGRTWHPTLEQRRRFPEIKPLVSNPWTILHGNAPPKPAKEIAAVDLAGSKAPVAATSKREHVLNVPAWHGTLLPQDDADVWLATAFADYERMVGREKALRGGRGHNDLSPAERDQLAVALFEQRSDYLTAARILGDVPLANIKSDIKSDDWYRLASGKGVLVLHELRRVLGGKVFEDAMDAFGREHGGKKVTTAQFQAHLERTAGKKLAWFFDSRVKQSRLPALRLGQVTAATVTATTVTGAAEVANPYRPKLNPYRALSTPVKTSYQVQGEILRDVVAPGVHGHGMKVDVTVETDTGEISQTVDVSSPRTEFLVPVTSGQPRRVVLDKYGDSGQTHSPVWSLGSFQRDQEHSLIVYGTADEVATNREAAESLQKLVRENGSNYTIPVKSDKEVTDAELKSHHIVLIGRPNSNVLVERFRRALPVDFGSRSFVVRAKTYAHPGSAVVAAADNPLNKSCSLVVIAGLSAEATFHAPQQFIWRGGAGEVLVLPHGAAAETLVLPPRDLVRAVSTTKSGSGE